MWYYSRGAQRIGPFSTTQLKQLADSGEILRTDTIWKDRREKGVVAGLLKNLYSVVPALVAVVPAVVTAAPASATRAPLVDPDDVQAVAPAPPPKQVAVSKRADAAPSRKCRAIAVKGAEIVSQDGAQARYRRMCKECGHKDSSCRTIAIANRPAHSFFFCPKCRKRRDVIIHGHMC
jgi:hypothetical protein